MFDDFSVWAEIDLDAIADNVAAIKQYVGNDVEIMAIIKANAYGHGTVPVAQTALANGAAWLGVGRVDEAITLRRAGIEAPILVMGYSPESTVKSVIENDLVLTISSMELAKSLSDAAQAAKKTVPIHVKVDTGMGRFGFEPHAALEVIRNLRNLPGLELQGIYTHFATADLVDRDYNNQQFETFCQLLNTLEKNGIHVPIRHAANSVTTVTKPEMHMDAVRVGIAMYGLSPSPELESAVKLRPALTLKSKVGLLRTLQAGDSVSYGRTFVASQPTRVALIPCGYGDGYFRLNSNRGSVLIRGKRAPIRGRICMDQMVVEVSGIEDANPDDEVVLIGSQGDDLISAEEVASWAETINYEVVTHLLSRVPRFFHRQGEWFGPLCQR